MPPPSKLDLPIAPYTFNVLLNASVAVEVLSTRFSLQKPRQQEKMVFLQRSDFDFDKKILPTPKYTTKENIDLNIFYKEYYEEMTLHGELIPIGDKTLFNNLVQRAKSSGNSLFLKELKRHKWTEQTLKLCFKTKRYLPLYCFHLNCKSPFGFKQNSYIAIKLKNQITSAWRRYLQRKKRIIKVEDFELCELSLLKKMKSNDYKCEHCKEKLTYLNFTLHRKDLSLEYPLKNIELIHTNCNRLV